ncbi:MAG: isoprenyl transferase [Bacteroidetes bacterium]|nr:isoprenyl transferase [Bacteroidota bacterium]
MPELHDLVDPTRLPLHIAIIMDGNGRWAKEKGAERIFGHHNGVTSLKNITTACTDLGIKYLTVYAFSTENWNRPKQEVDALMELLVASITNEMPTLLKNNVSLNAIGNLEQLPTRCRKELMDAIEKTSTNNGLTLVLALSYSGRWDIMNAIKGIVADAKTGKIDTDTITPEIMKSYLTTSFYPDPELLIRTGGERRVSNFLLWEIAYSELYFSDKLWPDFDKDDFYQAVIDYQKRERRFGKTSEQIKIT